MVWNADVKRTHSSANVFSAEQCVHLLNTTDSISSAAWFPDSLCFLAGYVIIFVFIPNISKVIFLSLVSLARWSKYSTFGLLMRRVTTQNTIIALDFHNLLRGRHLGFPLIPLIVVVSPRLQTMHLPKSWSGIRGGSLTLFFLSIPSLANWLR